MNEKTKKIRMKNPRRSRKAGSGKGWLIYLAIAAVTVSVFVTTIVDQQVKINNAREELAVLESQRELQELRNKDLEETVVAIKNNDDEACARYVEKYARKYFDYVKNGEVEYINTAGN